MIVSAVIVPPAETSAAPTPPPTFRLRAVSNEAGVSSYAPAAYTMAPLAL